MRRWWQGAEKPWEALAACMEVRTALATGNPAEYVSRLPVQIDGSCNGLQHYAALGRDIAGGYSVNLAPCDKPQVNCLIMQSPVVFYKAYPSLNLPYISLQVGAKSSISWTCQL